MSEPTTPQPARPRNSLKARARRILREDTAGIYPRLQLANLAAWLLPHDVASQVRARLLRMAGFQIGPGTIIRGRPHINGKANFYANLRIGRDCLIDVGCTLDIQELLTIGDRVTIGHETMLLTSSHEIGPKEHRAGRMYKAPLTIGDGAWIGPRCVILPGVTIGAGAVVSAGAMVSKDVPPNTRAAGLPAKQVEELA